MKYVVVVPIKANTVIRQRIGYNTDQSASRSCGTLSSSTMMMNTPSENALIGSAFGPVCAPWNAYVCFIKKTRRASLRVRGLIIGGRVPLIVSWAATRRPMGHM